jgi:hypothetical protein
MKKVFSKEYMIENRGCYKEKRVIDLFFKDSDNDVTIDDILNSEIPLKDKFWFVFLKTNMSNDDKTNLAIETAKIVLPIFENEFPSDNRPRMAIEASEKYLKGEITRDDLFDAHAAAEAAAASYSYAADAATSAARTARATRAVECAAHTALAAAYAARAVEYSDGEYHTNYTAQLQDLLKSFIKNLKECEQ